MLVFIWFSEKFVFLYFQWQTCRCQGWFFVQAYWLFYFLNRSRKIRKKLKKNARIELTILSWLNHPVINVRLVFLNSFLFYSNPDFSRLSSKNHKTIWCSLWRRCKTGMSSETTKCFFARLSQINRWFVFFYSLWPITSFFSGQLHVERDFDLVKDGYMRLTVQGLDFDDPPCNNGTSTLFALPDDYW